MLEILGAKNSGKYKSIIWAFEKVELPFSIEKWLC